MAKILYHRDVTWALAFAVNALKEYKSQYCVAQIALHKPTKKWVVTHHDTSSLMYAEYAYVLLIDWALWKRTDFDYFSEGFLAILNSRAEATLRAV